MKRIKECFSTPRRAVITSVCILAILAMVGTGTVLAAGAVAEHSSIGRGAAENYAFADAGIAPEDAAAIQTEFDFENGQFIYEVEFVADGKNMIIILRLRTVQLSRKRLRSRRGRP